MATPKPGEIRCPTCHRSTPPAAFCTQCGSAIPADARMRPRGMDRDELQERIRARRSGGEPYRRGGVPDEGTGIYERFEQQPEDAQARRGRKAEERRRDLFDEASEESDAGSAAGPAVVAGTAAARAAGTRPPDVTREPDAWDAPSPRTAPQPVPARDDPGADDDAPRVDAYDDERWYEEPAPDYDDEYDRWADDRRSSGSGILAILGFLALGVLALLGGAVLAGVFTGDPGVGGASPTPEASTPAIEASQSAAPSGSAAPSAGTSQAPSSPGASGEPVVFPDGFTAEAQPCLPGTSGLDGCNSNGATNGGTVEIWIGFAQGNNSDVIGATIVGPDGNTVGEGSIELADIGCSQSCQGYTYFNFSNLGAGTYEVRVTRNGQPASQTNFEVT